METAEIVAYVGAAAWVPQIITWLYKAVSRPKLRIIPDKNLSIGFTSNGPIFNLHMAFSAENKDALIEQLAVTLTHHDGETHRLVWAGHLEAYQVLGSDSSLQQTVQKDLPPVALKVATSSLVERFVRFQDQDFWDRQREALALTIDKQTYLNKVSKSPGSELLQSAEFDALMRVYKNSFWWRPGTYRVHFSASSPNGASLIDRDFHFSLTEHEVEAMRNNLGPIHTDFQNRIFQNDTEYQQVPLIYHWGNARLNPL